MTTLDTEVKQLIIESLNLEDMTIEDIDTNAALFVDGLGLDSIDALELGVAIKKKYNISISAENEAIKDHFQSVATLVKLIESHRG